MANTEKTHKCSVCRKSYTQLAHLREHERRVHQGVRYQCWQCKKTFHRESYHNSHAEKCKIKPHVICVKCGVIFNTKYQLQTQDLEHHHPTQKKQRVETQRLDVDPPTYSPIHLPEDEGDEHSSRV